MRYATSRTEAGSTSRWLNRQAPPLNTPLPLATKVPEPLPPLEGYTFEGYRNADGSVGTKICFGITTSVHCVAGVVDYVVKVTSAISPPKYPNVDGVVGLKPSVRGCGVAINAPAAVVQLIPRTRFIISRSTPILAAK